MFNLRLTDEQFGELQELARERQDRRWIETGQGKDTDGYKCWHCSTAFGPRRDQDGVAAPG